MILITLALEQLLKGYLRLDPVTREKLAKLSGKVILFHITDWKLTLYLLPLDDDLRLHSEYEHTPDVSITGTLTNFIQQSRHKHLVIAGDIFLAQAVNNMMLESQIDWEAILSVLTGDHIAHRANNLFKQLTHFKQQVKQNLAENLSEYLQEEILLLPSKAEVEDFFSSVRELTYQVDRLEAMFFRQ